MKEFDLKIETSKNILALGAESAGNFSIYKNNKIKYFNNYGDLIDDNNFTKFKKDIIDTLSKDNYYPDIIVSDLHPHFKTTTLAEELSNEYKSKLKQVQHHHAHAFQSFFKYNNKIKYDNDFIAITIDGTGLGIDGTIWGGEIFHIKNKKINRIAHLEHQVISSGDKSIKEPARFLIGILAKILKKEDIFKNVKKYYSKNEFELIYNQIKQNFNCQNTSSTARVMDASSILLDFSGNKRLTKHGPVQKLEANSSTPYELKPIILYKDHQQIIQTTPLFDYLIKNLDKNKKKLAGTVQSYIGNAFVEAVNNYVHQNDITKIKVFASGGMAENKIISKIFIDNKIFINKKIPSGDNGISIGQIIYTIFNN